MTTTHLLYLHGFRSSPQSAKARLMADHIARQHPQVQWWCPQLPPSPQEAMALVSAGIANWPRSAMAVVGSSLGGYYASWVAQQTGCPSVLLNPATDPARSLERHIGEQTAWHDPAEQFFFEPRFIDELRALDVSAHPAPKRQLAVIAKGDEVLDWRDMVARYPQAQLRLLGGGDHALSDFDQHLPAIIEFLQCA
ncbi:MAG: esterase [Burkholderiaceae bacterium]|nr:esterase [Burkholderiaceae bacterium]